MGITIDNSTLGAAAGWGMGIYWFFTGFRDLKAKRTIENIPTSKIMTGAVGSDVEIKGRIVCEPGKLVTAPISRVPCALYNITIQELRRSKNSSYWATVDAYFSDEGVYLDDASGATALVLVDGARITRRGENNEYRTRSNQFDTLPAPLRESLEQHKKKLRRFKLKTTSWLFSKEYRFLEWCFFAGETLYVLGFAESGFKTRPRPKMKLASFLKAKKMIRENPELQDKFDRNRDGFLDPDEFNRGARILAEKMQAKYSREKLEVLIPKTRMIFRKKKGHQFHISNLPERDLVQRMSGRALLKICGGPVLTIACTLYLLFQFEVL